MTSIYLSPTAFDIDRKHSPTRIITLHHTVHGNTDKEELHHLKSLGYQTQLNQSAT